MDTIYVMLLNGDYYGSGDFEYMSELVAHFTYNGMFGGKYADIKIIKDEHFTEVIRENYKDWIGYDYIERLLGERDK